MHVAAVSDLKRWEQIKMPFKNKISNVVNSTPASVKRSQPATLSRATGPDGALLPRLPCSSSRPPQTRRCCPSCRSHPPVGASTRTLPWCNTESMGVAGFGQKTNNQLAFSPRRSALRSIPVQDLSVIKRRPHETKIIKRGGQYLKVHCVKFVEQQGSCSQVAATLHCHL